MFASDVKLTPYPHDSRPWSGEATMSQRAKKPREREVERARVLLGDARVRALLGALRDNTSLLACKLVTDDIDAGRGLDEIFYTGRDMGFQLVASQVGADEYRVEFGCLADPESGDGRAWTVRFDADAVSRLTDLDEDWIA
ncbi:MAG: hypothetical protein WCJ30_06140 [Deltaproteobacteria bacterium]